MTSPETDNEQTLALIYLDHSAMNQICNDRHPTIRELCIRSNAQVVFSDENLNEISKSRDHEHEFLSLLASLNAKHLRLILDKGFHCTDRASIATIDPASAYSAYLQRRNETSALDGGIVDTLRKLYGGHVDQSFGQILQAGGRELIEEIKAIILDLSSDPAISQSELRTLVERLPEIEQLITVQYDTLAHQFDSSGSSANVKTIDTELDLGPKVLNNIQGPNVVKQVWNKISGQFPAGTMTCDEYFGAIRPRWLNADQPWTKLQQVNHVYHKLNFAGYKRDENMHRRFDAHFSDLTHVGMASFCQLFLSGDERQALKAAATYEYLGISTMVCHLKP